MKSRLKSFLSSEFKRNILTVVSGTVLAQALPILIIPILTRIYTPHDYGILGVFLGVSGIFNIVSTFNFPTAIIVPKEDFDAKKLFQLSLIVTTCVSLVSVVLIFLFGRVLSDLVNVPDLYYWLFFVPPVLFLYGLNFALVVYSNRYKKYRTLSVSKVAASIATIVVSLIIGILVKGPLGLILSTFINYLVSVTIVFYILMKEDKNLCFPIMKIHEAKEYFVRFKNFPLYTLPTDFINIFINQLPVFILGSVNPAKVGYFNISNRVLATPAQLVSSSIADVLKQRMSEDMHQREDCSPVYKRTFKPLFLLSLVPFLILFIFAPSIFAFVFGEKWRPAGTFTQFMTPYFFVKFLAMPFVPIYNLAMRQKEEFALHIYLLISSLLFIGTGLYILKDINWMIILFSLNYAGVYVFYLYRTYEFSKHLGKKKIQ